MRTTVTGLSKGEPSFPRELCFSAGCPSGLLQLQPQVHPQLCLCTASALTPGLTPSSACLAITGPWLTLGTATRPDPDMPSWLDHGPAPSFRPCPVTTRLWWTRLPSAGLTPTLSMTQPHSLALALPRHHSHCWAAICVTGDRPWWPGPALPALWGATMGSHHGLNTLKKEIHSVPLQTGSSKHYTPQKVLHSATTCTKGNPLPSNRKCKSLEERIDTEINSL